MQKYNIPYIPYDKNLVSRARELRKETTEAENLFWSKVLKNKKLAKFKFTRQKPLDCFIVDFYCASLGLAIEIDGAVHKFQKARDQERDNLLKQKFGLKIIRYTNEEVLNNMEKVFRDLLSKIQNATPP
ncbi:MAG: endonuclease domain-containing protein [Candidatus Colwellbacteria bacterium]|nr:endonuclease domain-containing protein [Candidatus Colwellbacteria bacterium]